MDIKGAIAMDTTLSNMNLKEESERMNLIQNGHDLTNAPLLKAKEEKKRAFRVERLIPHQLTPNPLKASPTRKLAITSHDIANPSTGIISPKQITKPQFPPNN